MTRLAISAADVRDAERAIRGAIVRTPLFENAVLNERFGGRLLIKFEGAQHVGSFKFRGAYNRLVRIPETERARGVVAWSSGNHAQGVAAAAARLSIPATIVMPADAPAIKIANTRALGATIIPYDRATESREDIARALVAKTGAWLVPSYDDPHIIAGQGTVGLELLDQCRDRGIEPGEVLVPCGGGGLVAGIATAIKAERPEIDIYCVEPEGFDDTARSLASGEPQPVQPDAQSICDALLAPTPGELTFPINRHLLTGGLVVDDAAVRAAMVVAFEVLKLVSEPGGAVGLAASLARGPRTDGRATIVVISGSNVDPGLFASVLGRGN